MTEHSVPWIVRHTDGHVATFFCSNVERGGDPQDGLDAYCALAPDSEERHGDITTCCPAHWLFDEKGNLVRG